MWLVRMITIENHVIHSNSTQNTAALIKVVCGSPSATAFYFQNTKDKELNSITIPGRVSCNPL